MVDVEQIKSLAKSKNLSLTQLEQAAGISNGVIGKWRDSSPNTDTLAKVCAVLGCKIDKVIKKDA